MFKESTIEYEMPKERMDLVKREITLRDNKLEQLVSSGELSSLDELEKIYREESRTRMVNIVSQLLITQAYALSPQLILAVTEAEKDSPYGRDKMHSKHYFWENTTRFLQPSRNYLFESQGIKSSSIKQVVSSIKRGQDKDVGILGGDRGLIYFRNKDRMIQALREDLFPVKVIYRIKGLTSEK